MKIHPHILVALTVALSTISAQAEDAPSLDTLPPAVQKVAREQLKGAAVDEIEPTYEDGKAATEVEFKRNGKPMAVVISPEGKLVQLEHRLSVGETPKEIQAAVTREFPGGKISHIKQIEKNGTAFYEISLHDAAGKVRALKLDLQGKAMKSKE